MPSCRPWKPSIHRSWRRLSPCPSSYRRRKSVPFGESFSFPGSPHIGGVGDVARKECHMERQEIPFLSVAALARHLEKKEVSPVEVTEAYLERIEALDDRLYAFLTVCRNEALQAAREAEQAIVRGQHRGPLHGIPVAGKGQPSTKRVCPNRGVPPLPP